MIRCTQPVRTSMLAWIHMPQTTLIAPLHSMTSVDTQTGAQEPLAVVGPQALERDDHERTADDRRGGCDAPAHDAAETTRRSLARLGSSLACTRLTPSPNARSMSRMFWTSRMKPP